MDHFAGLDVSVKETSICIVDDTGRIVKEVKVASEPEALLKVLGNQAYRFKRIGLEAGPLSQWLFSALAEAGLPVVCVETRHMKAVLKAQINKTDRNDARGALTVSWDQQFFYPIELPKGEKLVTLRDAALYITKLPMAEHDAAEWQAAMEALLLVAESGGPTMFARMAVTRVLNRHVERVFDPSRKDTHWGRRKLSRER